MKVLIFGPSGSGKTYVAKAWQQMGINAFDAAEIPRLENWYDQQGNKVLTPQTAEDAIAKQYAFLWSKKAMARFLAQQDTVYVFGGSGNIQNVFSLFDKVFFLQIDEAMQLQRLQSPLRPTPTMDADDNGPVIWGRWLEDMARKEHISFINADQTPSEIFKELSQR